MIRAHLCSSALAITLISGPAMAREQKAPETDVAGRTGATALSDVVVTATRSTQPIEKVGSSVTILTTEAIKASQATSAVELLVQTPSVSYARNGGPGSATSLYIRGAENQHTVVLIDGVKLNDPSSTQGGFNAGNLLVGDIARIEVLRGGQSTLWGSQAIGGVINLVTAEPSAALESSVSGEGGARNTAYLRAGAGGLGNRLTWRLAGSYYTTDGFSAYAGGKEKDAYQNSGLSGRARLAINPTASVEMRAVFSHGKADFDGFNTDSAEYGRTDEFVVYTGLNFTLLDGRWNSRLGYGYTDTDRENFNPGRTALPLTFEAVGKNRRWEYQGAFAVKEGVTANFGAERERSNMRTRSPSLFAPNPAFRSGRVGVDSVYGQIQAEPVSGLTLTGGLRHEDHEAYGAHSLGQASAAWSLNEGKTVVRASFGQGFRAPGLYELFSEYGNQQLQAEAFDSWDVGAEQRLWDSKARFSATVFKREADNEIRFFSCSSTMVDPLCRPGGVQRFGYYKNIQKTRAQGLEMVGQVQATDQLSFVANYTYTESENASGSNSGKQLTRRPKHLANISATHRWPVGLRTTVAARHVGKTFNNEANTVVVQAYTLVDLRASYPINERLEIYGRLENAFDESYQTILNYGVPGRGAFLGLRARF